MQSLDDIQPVTFGAYALLERLAMGGMAEVFLARTEAQERYVAIKRILPNIAADDDFIAMFIDEAKIAGQLTHPNIAQIVDIGKINSSYFIAMEYVSGQDLRALWDRVRESAVDDTAGIRGLPIGLACHIIKKLAEGLDYAHRKRDPKGRALGIIHRDVSPQNVLISYEGDLKIIDFGIAKAANRIVKTQTGILKGKFAYMAPEQARGEPIDHRSDIFAIGVVLYELLSGERAFKGDTDFVLLEKVRRVDVMPLRELRPDLPRELERIVMKALSREAGDRYAWASALAGDIDRFLSDQGISTSREELGAFLRRSFRTEHAEEQRRLDLYRRKTSDRTERIDTSGSSVVRGGSSAKNARALPKSSEEEADTAATQLGDLALQATAVAEPPPVERPVRVDRRRSPVVDEDPADTRKSLSRPRRRQADLEVPPDRSSSASPPASTRDNDNPPTGSNRRRRDAAVGAVVQAPDRANDGPSSLTSRRRERESQPPAESPRLTGDEFISLSSRRRRERDMPVAEPGTTTDTAASLSQMSAAFDQPPPLDGGDRERAVQHGASNVVVVVACLLGAVLGAGLGVGVSLASRASAPDTLIVVTPRQSEVRLGDVVICAQTPCAVHLGTGKHELLFQAPGADAVSRVVEVGEGPAVVDVVLDRTASALIIETTPAGATVILDDVLLPGSTPLTLPPLPVSKVVKLSVQKDGFEPLTAMRSVDGDDTWRFELPSPTTSTTITTVPADTAIRVGRSESTGKVVVNATRRGQDVAFTRPGCAGQTITVAGTGRASAEQVVTLECNDLVSAVAIVAAKKPSSVRIDGISLARGANLDRYPLPAGTWSVVVVSARGKREAFTVETHSGETTRVVTKGR